MALCGAPIGQYHCPYCGCMQVACIPHMCDPEICLLARCDCLPPGQIASINLQETLLRENQELRIIKAAARNLDAHRNEGYATLVSYLIRLREALEQASQGNPSDEQRDSRVEGIDQPQDDDGEQHQ